MPHSRRRLTAALTAAGSALSLAAAAGSWIVAFAVIDADAFRLAIALTVLGAVLGVAWGLTHVLTRVEECQDETRKQIDAAAARMVKIVPEAVKLQLFDVFAATIAEQIAAADRLNNAQRRWRGLVGSDTPIDLQQWRVERAADGAGQR